VIPLSPGRLVVDAVIICEISDPQQRAYAFPGTTGAIVFTSRRSEAEHRQDFLAELAALELAVSIFEKRSCKRGKCWSRATASR
jgi:hypothetical protein